jgi:hypothetical protein
LSRAGDKPPAIKDMHSRTLTKTGSSLVAKIPQQRWIEIINQSFAVTACKEWQGALLRAAFDFSFPSSGDYVSGFLHPVLRRSSPTFPSLSVTVSGNRSFIGCRRPTGALEG